MDSSRDQTLTDVEVPDRYRELGMSLGDERIGFSPIVLSMTPPPVTADEAETQCDEHGQNAWLRVELGMLQDGPHVVTQEVDVHGTVQHLATIGNGFPRERVVARKRGHWVRVCWRPQKDLTAAIYVEERWGRGWIGWGMPLLDQGATIEWDGPFEGDRETTAASRRPASVSKPRTALRDDLQTLHGEIVAGGMSTADQCEALYTLLERHGMRVP